MTAKPKRGRPTPFTTSVHEKILELAKTGKTNDQIAEIIGVTSRSIYNWQKKHVELFQSLKEAKQVADELVEASLYARAIGYSHPETKVFCYEGVITEHEVQKHYPPDVVATIFWLKNRNPERWREKQPGEADVIVNNIVNKSDEELDQRLQELSAKHLLKGNA